MVDEIDEDILSILSGVMDPEVPVLNIVEMGIVRGIKRTEKGTLVVSIVPTYTGCPAMLAIEKLVHEALIDSGHDNHHVQTLYHEVWTTDWMTDEAQEKLRAYGIAPPGRSTNRQSNPHCPYCGSGNTKVTSIFGSTACKSLNFCDECIQPFEHFKCH